MNDVTIIGAGPAGSLAAIVLARRNHSVVLVEQHRFPRDKVCGECLSAFGIEVLERHGLQTSIESLRPTRLARSELVAPDGSAATIDLPKIMWGISRSVLDTMLLRIAVGCGVEVLQPARCEGIDAGAVCVRDLDSNEVRRIESRYIVVADGKSACGLPRRAPASDLGVKAHFANVDSPRDVISLFGLSGHYVGLAAIEDGLWNVAMSVRVGRVREIGGDFDRLFEQLCLENRELGRRMRRSVRLTDWLASPLPRFAVASSWPRDVVPIGNAAAALEPIGGEGMGLALRSAELAAEEIDRALVEGCPIDVVMLRRAYNKLWRMRRFAARATALMMSNPRFAGMLVDAVNACASLPRPALLPLGKA